MVHVSQCAAVDSSPILRMYLQPGDLIIGAIVSQTLFVTSSKDFKRQSCGMLSEKFVYDKVQAVLENINSDDSQIVQDLFSIYKIPQSDMVGNDYMKGFLKSFSELYKKMMRSTANVIIFKGQARSFANTRGFIELVQIEYLMPKPKGKVWIVTVHMDLKIYHKKIRWEWDVQIFHGMISVSLHSYELQGFQEFFKNRKPSKAQGDAFLKDFWSYTFCCAFPDSVLGNVHQANCTGDETLKDLPAFEMSMTGHSYSIYNAVYAVAYALHAMYSSKILARMQGERRKLTNHQPWQVAHPLCNLESNIVTG
uniref:Uncharacterized protein n=1 Tax=Sphaerodactylus townsendi TaxID=933632 RepID=A0ACB8EV75_9SAUR